MTLFVRGCLVLLAACSTLGASTAFAADPAPVDPPARTRLFFVLKGSQEVVNFGTIRDPLAYDRFIVIVLGTGNFKVQVNDADVTGDAINVVGSLQSVFPSTFDVSATSPAAVNLALPVIGISVVRFDVCYDSIVNGTPANYVYRLKF